jgi:hypothetical protein
MKCRDAIVPNFSRDYLRTFYSDGPTPDELAVFDFLVRHYPRMGSSRAMIEVGCGPAVHHVLPAVPYVSEIHMADFLEENLEHVLAWREGRSDAHDWQAFTRLTLTLEGRSAAEGEVALREGELRKRMTAFLRCDLRGDPPLGQHVSYAVVGCFYCTEVVGCSDLASASKDEWRRVLRRVTDLVAPGGHLFLSALKESRFYALYSADGTTRRLPTTFLTEQDFHETLPGFGFDMRETIIESRDFSGQEAEGLHGVILVAGRKRV